MSNELQIRSLNPETGTIVRAGDLTPYRSAVFNQMNEILRIEALVGRVVSSEYRGDDNLASARNNLGILFGWVEGHTSLGRCMLETGLVVELYRPLLNRITGFTSPKGAILLYAGGLCYLDEWHPNKYGFGNVWAQVNYQFLKDCNEGGKAKVVKRIANLNRQDAARKVVSIFRP